VGGQVSQEIAMTVRITVPDNVTINDLVAPIFAALQPFKDPTEIEPIIEIEDDETGKIYC
jgi:hypothetical protein